MHTVVFLFIFCSLFRYSWSDMFKILLNGPCYGPHCTTPCRSSSGEVCTAAIWTSLPWTAWQWTFMDNLNLIVVHPKTLDCLATVFQIRNSICLHQIVNFLTIICWSTSPAGICTRNVSQACNFRTQKYQDYKNSYLCMHWISFLEVMHTDIIYPP